MYGKNVYEQLVADITLEIPELKEPMLKLLSAISACNLFDFVDQFKDDKLICLLVNPKSTKSIVKIMKAIRKKKFNDNSDESKTYYATQVNRLIILKMQYMYKFISKWYAFAPAIMEDINRLKQYYLYMRVLKSMCDLNNFGSMMTVKELVSKIIMEINGKLTTMHLSNDISIQLDLAEIKLGMFNDFLLERSALFACSKSKSFL